MVDKIAKAYLSRSEGIYTSFSLFTWGKLRAPVLWFSSPVKGEETAGFKGVGHVSVGRRNQ